MRKHERECLALLGEHGLIVSSLVHRSGHLAATTNRGTVFLPGTPSDRRWKLNARALIRRLAKP